MAKTVELERLKDEARRCLYNLKQPEDIEKCLNLWKEVWGVDPQDDEANREVARLEQAQGVLNEYRKLKREYEHLLALAQRDTLDATEELARKRKEFNAKVEQMLGRVKALDIAVPGIDTERLRQMKGTVERAYQELALRHGKIPTIALRGTLDTLRQALREGRQAMGQGKVEEVFDPKTEKVRPLAELIEEWEQEYLKQLPEFVNKRRDSIEVYLKADPRRARDIWEEVWGYVTEEALSPERRKELENKYAEEFQKYKMLIEQKIPKFEDLLRQLEQAKASKDAIERARLLRTIVPLAQKEFPGWSDVMWVWEQTRSMLPWSIWKAITAGRQHAMQLRSKRKYQDAQRIFGHLLSLLEEFEKELPEDWIQGTRRTLQEELEALVREGHLYQQMRALLDKIDQVIEAGRWQEAAYFLEQVPEAFRDLPEVQDREFRLKKGQRQTQARKQFFEAYRQKQWKRVLEVAAALDESDQDLEVFRVRAEALSRVERVQQQADRLVQLLRTQEWVEALRVLQTLVDGYETALEVFRKAGVDEITRSERERLEAEVGVLREVKRLLSQALPLYRGQERWNWERWRDLWRESQRLPYEVGIAAVVEALQSGIRQAYQEALERATRQMVRERERLRTEVGERLVHAWRDLGEQDRADELESQMWQARLEALIEENWERCAPDSFEQAQKWLIRLGWVAGREVQRQWEKKVREWKRHCIKRRLDTLSEEDKDGIGDLLKQGGAGLPVQGDEGDELLPGEILELIVRRGWWDVLQNFRKQFRQLNEWMAPEAQKVWGEVLDELLERWAMVQRVVQGGDVFPDEWEKVTERLMRLADQTRVEDREGLKGLVQKILDEAAAQWRQRLHEAFKKTLITEGCAPEVIRIALALVRLGDVRGLGSRWRRRLEECIEEIWRTHWGTVRERMVQALREGQASQHVTQEYSEILGHVEELAQLLNKRLEVDAGYQRRLLEWEKKVYELLRAYRKLFDASHPRDVQGFLEALKALEGLYQQLSNEFVGDEPLYEALHVFGRKLSTHTRALEGFHEVYKEWRQALDKEDFETAQKLLEELLQRWYQIRDEHKLPLAPVVHRYVYLGMRAEKPEEHREALQKILDNLRAWRRREERVSSALAELERELTLWSDGSGIRWDVLQDSRQRPLEEIWQELKARGQYWRELLKDEALPVYSAKAEDYQEQWEAKREQLRERLAMWDRYLQQLAARVEQIRECFEKLREDFLDVERLLRKYQREKKGWRRKARGVSPLRIRELQQQMERCRELDPYAHRQLLEEVEQLVRRLS